VVGQLMGRRLRPHVGKGQEFGPKRGLKFVTAGAPGRGVLRFPAGGIQESRSFLGQKRPKNRKIDRLRG